MLVKLLKYDLKYMVKNMAIFYILAIVFAILTRVLFGINQSFMITLLGHICSGCVISMVASIFFNTLIRSWIRFRDSLYKDEAYLTHTLPVSKSDIYNSRFIQALVFFIIGFLVMLLSLFIAYYHKDTWLMIKNYIGLITNGLGMSTMVFIISMLGVIFLEMFNVVQCGFLGIILGYKRNSNKIAFSFAFGLVFYFVSQSIVLLLVFLVGLFNGDIMGLFYTTTTLNVEALKLLMIISIMFYIVVIISMSFVCKKELNKGVNLE